MGKICTICMETYNDSIASLKKGTASDDGKYACPKRGCFGKITDIDDVLIPTIKVLKSKGYYTESSCGGHPDDMFPVAYITFEECIDKIDTIPKGYRATYSIGTLGEKKFTISKTISGETEVDIFSHVLRNAFDLYVWALNLPEVTVDEFFATTGYSPAASSIDIKKMKEELGCSDVANISDFKGFLKNCSYGSLKSKEDSKVKEEIKKPLEGNLESPKNKGKNKKDKDGD